MIYWRLFVGFMQFGIFGVGGGYAAIPLIRAIAVTQNGWLTEEVFSDLITIAEMTPGPIGVNAATFVGLRMGGMVGAVCATLGSIFPSLILVSLLAWAYARSRGGRRMQRVLGTLRAVMTALIASAALMLARSATMLNGAFLPCGAAMFVGALALLRIRKPNPILVMTGCGALAAVFHAIGWL